MKEMWPWMALVALLVVTLSVALAWRQRLARASAALGETDRFSAVPAISAVQSEMLQYLVKAFPGRPVLFRAPLSRLVAVRQAENRLGAQRRLAEHLVDYVVCNKDGKPTYAFELDAVHEDTTEAERDAAEKHRVLKTAGIRLIRLKRSTRDLPEPREFRSHLQSAAIEPTAPDSQRSALQSASWDAPGPSSAAVQAGRESTPMSLTDLMKLPPAPDADDPWGGSPRHR